LVLKKRKEGERRKEKKKKKCEGGERWLGGWWLGFRLHGTQDTVPVDLGVEWSLCVRLLL